MPPTALKAFLLNLPDHYFETFTFGELKIGDKFIVFPDPPINGNPGGFKEIFTVYTKTKDHVSELRGVHYETPHGRATSKMRTRLMDFSLNTPVIGVE